MPTAPDRVRLTSKDSTHWLEVAALRPPGASGKPRRDASGDFWGSVTLHTPDDHIRAYVGWLPDSDPLAGSDRALGLVDFSLFPHLEREDMPDTSLANIEKWAAGLSVPA
jgi:hypothetical protein